MASVQEVHISLGEGSARVGYDARQRFERGTAAVDEGRCADAIEDEYEPLVRSFPSSRYVSAALYNAALCLERSDDPAAAVPYYERLVARGIDTRDGRQAALQLVALETRLGRVEPALALAERTLRRDDVSGQARLELLARRAELLLAAERLDDAARAAADTLAYDEELRRRPSGSALPPAFVAAADYVLAETLRRRAEGLDLSDTEGRDAVERRLELVLRAERQYFRTIVRGDPRWVAAAGEHLVDMFATLRAALSGRPSLPDRLGPLLRQVVRYGELTLDAAARAGAGAWTPTSRADLDQLRRLCS